MGRALRSRDPHAAAHTTRLILLVCAAVVAGLTIVQQSGAAPGILAAHWSGVALLLVGALACTVLRPETVDRMGIGVIAAMAGVALICALNLITHDSSAAAQAFFSFPVFWAASNLRAGGVALVTGTALVADGMTLFLLLPPAAAVTDLVFVGAALVVLAVLLVRAGNTQERLVAALQQQARVDSLTGLVNRRAFDETLEASLNRPVAAGTALVLIDVDAFKTINDRHGHPVGDDVLVHLAAVLREQVRAEDAVLSRLGGDELAVLLPGCTVEGAERRAEELLEAVRANPLLLRDGTLLSLSISLGVAHTPRQAGKLRTLYHAADVALYDAKRSGRGRVAVAGA
ncbi:MAG: Diguanylate cyclase protein [Blastococcus sp.]|nr:Diguanylate cyclase protein [Blastococcus sp.]